ncbi:MAG: hypothetical protein KI790_19335, partial [Cyclobacteriaceae bacterium]|nr:hypothetical protein [Cyclobacteriaceae bacterium HetDA_MAG_MS6]
DFPMLQVEITEMLTEYVLQQLKAGDIDVGIISTPIRRPGISVTPLFYERFYLYSSDLHNSDTEFLVENIDYQALWLLEEGNCFRDQINDFCSIRNQPEKKQMTYRCNSIDSLIRMVDQYGGTTILPELTTISLSEEQSQHVVSIAGKAREIGLVARNAVNKERYIKLLEKYILENIPRKLKDPNGLEIVDPGISLD